MRQVILTAQANRRLQSQIDYLLERHRKQAARALRVRVAAYLTDSLAHFPRTGTFIDQRGLWESWIPGTRIVAWYQFDEATLTVLTFWNTSQDRQSSAP
jgi:plasmid stabilization system protein ParE